MIMFVLWNMINMIFVSISVLVMFYVIFLGGFVVLFLILFIGFLIDIILVFFVGCFYEILFKSWFCK